MDYTINESKHVEKGKHVVPIRRFRRTIGMKTIENKNRTRETALCSPHFVNCNKEMVRRMRKRPDARTVSIWNTPSTSMLNALNNESDTLSKSSMPATIALKRDFIARAFWHSTKLTGPTIASVTAGIFADQYPKTMGDSNNCDCKHKQQPSA